MPRLTVTLPPELVQEVRSRVGPGEISAWVAQALAERLGREDLLAAVVEYEAETGPITDEDIAAAKRHTAWEPAKGRRKPPAAWAFSMRER